MVYSCSANKKTIISKDAELLNSPVKYTCSASELFMTGRNPPEQPHKPEKLLKQFIVWLMKETIRLLKLTRRSHSSQLKPNTKPQIRC